MDLFASDILNCDINSNMREWRSWMSSNEGEGRKIYDRFCSISGPNVAKLKSINKAWVQIGYFLPLVVRPILHL